MIVSSYRAEELSEAFGIDMSHLPGLGLGAGFGRVVPTGRSTAHQHDETEVFVILRGTGEVSVDGHRAEVGPGSVVVLEPFETHVIANTGPDDLLFFDLYWRDPSAAARAAAGETTRRRFGERPVFVFSTPPTPNGDLHLGHLSGPYLGADVYVRSLRMHGVRAWHLTGSDDHQSYVVERARRDQADPRGTAARFAAEIAETLRLMDISVDQYTVTSADETYAKGLQGFFTRLAGSGPVRLQEDTGIFDATTGDYLYEVNVSGGCPGCGTAINGNICEECGEPNVCTDLAEPRSHRSAVPPRPGPVIRFSLPLHEFRDEVAVHQSLGRAPARLRELAGRVFARGRLDLPLTHPAGWGVPPAEPGAAGQVIWVWPEMAYGFLHGVERLGQRLAEPWQADKPDPEWKIVHFFGYDNSFYHSLLYPVLYRLAWPDWQPDVDYHVNEFYLLDGEKFSTSRQHAIWGKEILGPRSVDAVRYHLAATRPEGRRTNFNRAEYTATVRDTLIGSWQNWLCELGERVRRWYGGRAPDAGVWTPEHTGLLHRLRIRLVTLSAALGPDAFSLNAAAAELDGIVTDVRRFAAQEYLVSDMDEWRDETRTAVALELAAARLLAHCAAPVLPQFAQVLAARLGLPEPTVWPALVDLVPAGTAVDLTGAEFFQAGRTAEEDARHG